MTYDLEQLDWPIPFAHAKLYGSDDLTQFTVVPFGEDGQDDWDRNRAFTDFLCAVNCAAAVQPRIKDVSSGVIYRAWVGLDGQVGYRCTFPDKRVTYVYLNPTTESDDGVPTVFVYSGGQGEPAHDEPIVHVTVHRPK